MPRTTVDSRGRVLVPAETRRALGLRPSSTLVASIEDGRLVLTPRDDRWKCLRALFAGIEGTPSVVDELIAERRANEADPDHDVALLTHPSGNVRAPLN